MKSSVIFHYAVFFRIAGEHRWSDRAKTWQKNGPQAFEIKLRPSRRREAATVTDRLVVAKRRPSCHRRDAKRRQRPSRRREAATATTSPPRRLCRRREATTATVSSPRSGDRHDHGRLVVAKRRPSCCRREATTATVASPRSGVTTMNDRPSYRCREATTAAVSSPQSGVRHKHHHLAVTKRRPSCRREATTATAVAAKWRSSSRPRRSP